MTRARWVRAALIGLVVAEAVVLAWGGPRWRTAPLGGARLAGFGPDGRECYTGRGSDWRAWDVRTGACRAMTLDLPAVNPDDRSEQLSADGRWYLVGDPTAAPTSDRAWHMFDAATGRVSSRPGRRRPAPGATCRPTVAGWPSTTTGARGRKPSRS